MIGMVDILSNTFAEVLPSVSTFIVMLTCWKRKGWLEKTWAWAQYPGKPVLKEPVLGSEFSFTKMGTNYN